MPSNPPPAVLTLSSRALPLNRERFQHVQIAAIVALLGDGRLEYKRLCAQFGMRQYPMKSRVADISFPDIRVPVDVGTERAFAIVAVNHVDIFQSEVLLRGAYGGAQSGLRYNVEARRE
jgi:hypothetical protein